MALVVLDNLNKIRSRIADAAVRSGRNPESVGLVAVTKYAPLESIKELLDCGLVTEAGENRVQDAKNKIESLGEKARKVKWRLIGHLQSNKAKHALQVFSAIDSLDSMKLAEVLEKELAAEDRKFPVLVQVKLSDKETQFGLAPEELKDFLESLKTCPHLDARGLMAIAPALEPVEDVRPHFARMRELFDRFFAGRPEARLSMGMSRDYEIAVEEGATHVRIGSSIFS